MKRMLRGQLTVVGSLGLVLAMLVACGASDASSTPSGERVTRLGAGDSLPSLARPAGFEGTLPCADCDDNGLLDECELLISAQGWEQLPCKRSITLLSDSEGSADSVGKQLRRQVLQRTEQRENPGYLLGGPA